MDGLSVNLIISGRSGIELLLVKISHSCPNEYNGRCWRFGPQAKKAITAFYNNSNEELTKQLLLSFSVSFR